MLAMDHFAVRMREEAMMRERGEEISYLALATLPSAPFWARTQTKTALKARSMPSELIDAAELLVSELVTNAIQISGPVPGQVPASGLDGVERITITLRLMPGRILIEVFDNDHNPPVLADADSDAESGRGLMLVQALSKEWGHIFHPSGGKTVYCTIAAPETALAPGHG